MKLIFAFTVGLFLGASFATALMAASLYDSKPRPLTWREPYEDGMFV